MDRTNRIKQLETILAVLEGSEWISDAEEGTYCIECEGTSQGHHYRHSDNCDWVKASTIVKDELEELS